MNITRALVFLGLLVVATFVVTFAACGAPQAADTPIPAQPTQAATRPPDTAVAPTQATTAPPPTEDNPVAEGPDANCIDCHTDQERLMAVAKVVQETEDLSEGDG